MEKLRTAIVIDYQNLHLSAHGMFKPDDPKHEALIHPGFYAKNLIQARNQKARPDLQATLDRVDVYRGLPSQKHDPKGYARNLAQKSEWEKEPLVSVVHRPLKYKYKYTADGRRATDSAGNELASRPEEKGVDVLCALGLVRRSLESDFDLVIMCTQDSDLSHALDEVLIYNHARVETASWFDKTNYGASKEIRPTIAGRRIWNTRMNEQAFYGSLDYKNYT